MPSLTLGQSNQNRDEIWILGQMRRLDIPQTSSHVGGEGMSGSFNTAKMLTAKMMIASVLYRRK